jgi:hypothetical protein
LQTGEHRLYQWGVKKFWGGEHQMLDEEGRTVFVLTRGVGDSRWTDIFKQQATVRIEGTVSDGRTMSILMLFAWWMILVQAQEAAGAAAVVAISG